jgi:xanthine dehydrogenase iron-sulfur cluster and FAD-binding subunit A
MAVIRDVMPAFELVQPTSIADAQKLLQQHGADAWIMAGGLDSFDWLKDRIKKPKVLVDLSGIAELKGIRTTGDGIEIGALTTLTEVVKHPVIREKYSLLAEAPKRPLRRRSGTRARSAAMYRRTRAAGITARVGRATGLAETCAMPTRPPAATASTRFFTPIDAWR